MSVGKQISKLNREVCSFHSEKEPHDKVHLIGQTPRRMNERWIITVVSTMARNESDETCRHTIVFPHHIQAPSVAIETSFLNSAPFPIKWLKMETAKSFLEKTWNGEMKRGMTSILSSKENFMHEMNCSFPNKAVSTATEKNRHSLKYFLQASAFAHRL